METSQPKRKRGRPPRDRSGDSPTPRKTEEVAARTARYGARPFYAQLSGGIGERALIMVDAKGKMVSPDFRTFVGAERALVRSFSAEIKRSAHNWAWDGPANTASDGIVIDPSEALIDLAASVGALTNEDREPLKLVPGEYRCAFELDDPLAAKVRVSSVLINKENGDIVRPEGGWLDPVSQSIMRSGQDLYRVDPLGSWFEHLSFKREMVPRSELEALLSIARSLVPSLGIVARGWSSQHTRPVLARPAVLFCEIDPYGFLHVRPIVHLDGYPPGFFEDQEVVEIVRLDDDEQLLHISEVLFPENPVDTLRSLLSKYRPASSSSSRATDSCVYEEDGLFILEGEFARSFLEEQMVTLMQNFILLETSVLEKYRLRIAKPRLKMTLKSGIDYFHGRADVSLAGESLPFGRFLDQYRKQGYIILSDGSRAWPERDDVERFSRLIAKVKGEEGEVEVSFFDLPALHGSEGVEGEGEGWLRIDSFIRGYNTIGKRPMETTLPESVLRPYQEYGVRWLDYLREHRLGACLADEMGLGKTLQIIVMLRNAYSQGMTGNTLILVPRSLIFNWEAEFTRFAPELPILVHYGISRDVYALKSAQNAVILSSYATLRNDIAELKEEDFAYVILDESQNIKNFETKTSRAVRGLRARHRIAMSGTPIENSLGDLYSLFRFLNPSFFGTEAAFNREYLQPIQEDKNETVLKDLKRRLYPYMLRRAKKDVLADLPEKTEQTALIELSPEHLAIYRERAAELKERIEKAIALDGLFKSSFLILQALTELRRLAGVPEADGEFLGTSAKREYLRETIASIVADGHKCLVFTNFLASVDLVSEDLAALGIGNLLMTGATVNRRALVEQFQNDPSIGVFIMTLKTGGVGLNLTAADYVFILDPWWNRAAEQQAIDRTHRIGQVNPVFCYRMIAKDTIEERILELQNRKANLAEALLAADTAAVKSLSEEDIEYLLG